MFSIHAIREMHIKTVLRFLLTTVRMAKISRTNKCWGVCGNRDPPFTVGWNANWRSQSGSQYKHTSIELIPKKDSSQWSLGSWSEFSRGVNLWDLSPSPLVYLLILQGQILFIQPLWEIPSMQTSWYFSSWNLSKYYHVF